MSRTPEDPSLFFDEWQACLRAHYIYVIRAQDAVTEPTLRSVLLHSGLSEDDLIALQEEAFALGPLNSDAALPEEMDVDLIAEPGDDSSDDLLALPPEIEEPEEEGGEGEETGGDVEDEPPPQYGGQLSLF